MQLKVFGPEIMLIKTATCTLAVIRAIRVIGG